jgi:sugar phosphate isomerase/epimerase
LPPSGSPKYLLGMNPFPLSGLADEAADDIAGQVAAQQALGWPCIELRLIDGKQVSSAATSDDDFARAMDRIESAGLRVSSFGSAIGNWSRPINGDFATDLADLKVLIPRMQRAKTRFVRTMSWMQAGTDDATWRDEGVRRYKEMAKYAADGGILLLHENCEGWGGHTASNAREFMERVDHPNVRYLFDMGNTASYGQDTLEFYEAVKPFIEYVHVKDCRRSSDGSKSNAFTYPGEGDAKVREILSDLIRRGYKAGVTIEPHVANIVHLGAGATKATPEQRFASYVKYGRDLEKLIASLV